jgi:hypothetical protein
VFALMVLLPSVAFARSEYLCRFDGQVRSSCCCPGEMRRHEAQPSTSVTSVTSIRDASCCTVTVFDGAPSRVQPATDDNQAGARSYLPVFVATVSAQASVVSPSVPAVAPLPRSTAPPDGGQDLFVRHCAFLL